MEKERKDKEERKVIVKEARKELKEKGVIGYIIKPTIQYWKNNPLDAIWRFSLWATIFFTIFTTISAINNDLIYCDSSIDKYDGKLMNTYNKYVEDINNRTNEISKTIYFEKDFNPDKVKKESIVCKYNITRWLEEPISERVKSVGNNWIKIALKRK